VSPALRLRGLYSCDGADVTNGRSASRTVDRSSRASAVRLLRPRSLGERLDNGGTRISKGDRADRTDRLLGSPSSRAERVARSRGICTARRSGIAAPRGSRGVRGAVCRRNPPAPRLAEFAEDRDRPQRHCRLNADPKILSFVVVDGEERCAGAGHSTPRQFSANSARLRELRVKYRCGRSVQPSTDPSTRSPLARDDVVPAGEISPPTRSRSCLFRQIAVQDPRSAVAESRSPVAERRAGTGSATGKLRATAPAPRAATG